VLSYTNSLNVESLLELCMQYRLLFGKGELTFDLKLTLC